MDEMKMKANSVEELHKMVLEMLSLADRYNDKYPEFNVELVVSHSDLLAYFKVYRDEQTKGC